MDGMGRSDAEVLLEEVAGIRNGTRASLWATGWQWLTVWAFVFFGAFLTAVIPGLQSIAGIYWLFAVPIALILTTVISIRADAKAGVRRNAGPYWAIGAALSVAAFGSSAVFPEEVVVVVVWVWTGLAFAGFALLERQPHAAVLLAAMGVGSGLLGMFVEDTFELYPMLALAFSVALAGIAVGIKVQAHRTVQR